MNKRISFLYLVIITINAYTAVPFGSKLVYGKDGISIPSPLLLIKMVIVPVGNFLMKIQKYTDGKDGSSKMVWLKPLVALDSCVYSNNIS